MDEKELQQNLQRLYPVENEGCEWKEFKRLRHAVSGNKGADIISYLSALANMNGGHLVIGVKDKTLKIIGIQDFHDYTPENIRQRILGKCTHLDSKKFSIDTFTTNDSGKTVWVFNVPAHLPRLPVYAHDKAWQRIGDSLVPLRSERLETISTVILLDRVQKKQPITDTAAAMLRRQGLIEGRKPHYFVSAKVAAATDTVASYTRSKGLEKQKLKEFILQHLREFGPAPRARLEELLFEMLPADLTEKKKRNKVKNLLTEMRAKDRTIKSKGKGHDHKWFLI